MSPDMPTTADATVAFVGNAKVSIVLVRKSARLKVIHLYMAATNVLLGELAASRQMLLAGP